MCYRHVHPKDTEKTVARDFAFSKLNTAWQAAEREESQNERKREKVHTCLSPFPPLQTPAMQAS